MLGGKNCDESKMDYPKIYGRFDYETHQFMA